MTKEDIDVIAREFARRVHLGQMYGNGDPYITHLERVANYFTGSVTLRAIAWLHDTVEDTHTSLGTIYTMFGYTIGSAVDAITRREETYSEYLTRIESNSFALQIKLIDLTDNLSNCYNSRGKVGQDYIVRQKRYVKAIRRLLRYNKK